MQCHMRLSKQSGSFLTPKTINMAKKAKKVLKGKRSELIIVNPNAAGIDIASAEYQVCVPEDRDKNPNRRFEAFTCDLHSIAQWLKECGIETVAMEATGIFWVQIFYVLQDYGFDVVLCNAKHIKNIAEKKTDYVDASWIQMLHTYGLLKASFQPQNQVAQLKDLIRHRERLVKRMDQDILRMQKSLDMMNIKVHKVLSDIKGKSGISILNAIINGERRPLELAQLVDHRVKATKEEIRKSLEGNWNDAQLFILKQNFESYFFVLKQMKDLDITIEKALESYSSAIKSEDKPIIRATKDLKKGNAFNFDAELYSHQILGVNIVRIPGISSLSAIKAISELGKDFPSKFDTYKHFCSWLNVVPNNQQTGGKVKSSKVPTRKNFAGQVFRVAANTLKNQKGYLGDYFRKIKSRKGHNQAIVAVAHKLARIVYHMVKYQVEYDDTLENQKNHQMLVLKKQALERKLQKINKDLELHSYNLAS